MEDFKYAEVLNNQVVIPYTAKDKTRLLVKIFDIDHASDGQVNLLRMWLRLISEETGHNWRRLYSDSCFSVGIDKEFKELGNAEIQEILRDLESLASELEIVLPFPTKWNRRNNKYAV
jgi:hypothetical protein